MNTLFYYLETLLQGLPEALNYFRASTPAGFRDATERLLHRAIEHLEVSANQLRHSSEDTITVAAIGFLNRYGICATYQTNSRGHVDLYIMHSARIIRTSTERSLPITITIQGIGSECSMLL